MVFKFYIKVYDKKILKCMIFNIKVMFMYMMKYINQYDIFIKVYDK